MSMRAPLARRAHTPRLAPRVAGQARDVQESMASQANLDARALNYAQQDFPVLHPRETIREALNKFRTGGLTHKIIYFYVVDDSNRLLGVLPTRLLLTADLDTPVEEIFVRKALALPSTATLGEAREAFAKHQFLAFPIVDESERLLGVLDIQHFAGKLNNLHERTSYGDIFELLGLPSDIREDAPAWIKFRGRFPWLMSTIVTGSLAALLTSRFEATLTARISLAFFLTMTLGLNESVAMQSATLAIHRLHAAGVGAAHVIKAAAREVAVAWLLGLACGSIVFALVECWRHDIQSAASIGLSLIASIVVSCLWGLLIPTLLRKLRADPRVAAAPIALGLSDLTALALYFWLAERIITAG